MKFEFEITAVGGSDKSKVLNDGQITTKLPKSAEEDFKVCNIKYGKELSETMRSFALFLIDKYKSLESETP